MFVSLVYDYGASFGVMAEDLKFEYQFTGMTFRPDISTIDVFGTAQDLGTYVASLRQFAQAHLGDVLVNLDPPAPPDYKGFALSFYTADGVSQERSGLVHLNVAFDILSNAAPGPYAVTFSSASGEESLLADADGNAFVYPAALQQLSVTVSAVPEPHHTAMLLLGLGIVGVCARRRPVVR